MVDTEVLCSRCKEGLVVMTSTETQTDDFLGASNVVESQNDVGAKEGHAVDTGSQSIEPCTLEGVKYSREDQLVVGDNEEALDFAVFQQVVDEILEVDSSMEIGTAAEMSNLGNEIVILTRSFEASSNPRARWKKTVNASKAVHRLKRKRRDAEENEVLHEEPTFANEEDEILCSGVRRIVISNGRFNLHQRHTSSEVFLPEPLNEAAVNEDSVLREVERENPAANGRSELQRDHADCGEISDLGSPFEASEDKDRLRRASNVLGPNKKCLQVQEEHQNIDPEKDLGLSNGNNGAFDVVVLTRSFESISTTDEETMAQQRWSNLKNATRFSRAVNRMRSFRQQRDGASASQASDENEPRFIGGGYRKVSMKTVDEIVNIAARRNRFWRRSLR